MGVETISVYLLKSHVTGPGDALRADAQVTGEHSVAEGETRGVLFVSDGDEHEPGWVRLLGPASNPPLSRPRSATSAVLVLSIANRWFALTFGNGRHMLERRSFERDFGLKVALNSVDPERLRGAQARTFNDYALHTLRQSSRLSDIFALEVNVQRDMVTALDGVLRDEAIGNRIDGRDAARLTAELDVAAIAPKCAELLRLSKEERYKQDFPWVGTIEEIRDPEQVEAVESLAFTALGKREFSRFDLYPPELLATEIVEFRRWPGNRSKVIVEPQSRLLLSEAINAPMSARSAQQAVERFHLVGVDAAGKRVESWTYFECLHFETNHEGATYVLDGGCWYRIEPSLVNEVERAIEKLKPSGLELPPAKRGQIERDYNEHAAERNDLTLVDRKLVYLGSRSSVEPCDLLSDARHLVHVKPRKGGSSPLSHLFAQAVVSANCLVGEPQFREQFRGHLHRAAPSFEPLLAEPIQPSDFSIVLALITDSSSGSGYPARELPFFSKLNLRLAVQHLQNMKFSVYVDEIPRAFGVSQTPPTPRRRHRRPARSAAVRAERDRA